MPKIEIIRQQEKRKLEQTKNKIIPIRCPVVREQLNKLHHEIIL